MPDTLISDGVLQSIKDSVKTETIDVDGRQFVTRPVYDPPKAPEPEPAHIEVHTLTGFVDYVNGIKEMDPIAAGGIKCIHVFDPGNVFLSGGLIEKSLRRHHFAQAAYIKHGEALGFRLGHFCEAETFIIALQALFDDQGDRAKILQLVGNLTQEAVQTSSDDGVTQIVGTRAGVVLKGKSEVPNPVRLAPYRTFAEVTQPISTYVFRIRQGENLPQMALYPADGDAWKLEAIKRIKDFLAARITTVPIIA